MKDFEQHEPAREWLDGVLAGPYRVGLPWSSVLGFLRVVTNPRLFSRPSPVERAWRQVESWLDSDVAWTPLPTERHPETLGTLLALVGAGGNLVADAHLAALALEHGLTRCTTDGDFARFPGLRVENPIAA